MSLNRLDRVEARRIAVRAQLLDARRPTDLLAVVNQLTFLQLDVPKANRRWGYFALPVLHHDQLVGKVDATADRKKSVLHVHAIHQDVRFTRAMTAAVHAEFEALASWLDLSAVSSGISSSMSSS